jgi:mannose-1-phosphate guanylyltransferase / mannose-6-phosphate isomerase
VVEIGFHNNIQPIMGGGAAARQLPESRNKMSKRFVALIAPRSTFQDSVLRIASEQFEARIVVADHDYRLLVKEQLEQIGAKATIVAEPVWRDSVPASAIAAARSAECDPQCGVALVASGHVVTKQAELLAAREAAASGSVVTSGIEPTEPVIGYGHIEPGAPLPGGRAAKVESFVEMPEPAVAERYVARGYLWTPAISTSAPTR